MHFSSSNRSTSFLSLSNYTQCLLFVSAFLVIPYLLSAQHTGSDTNMPVFSSDQKNESKVEVLVLGTFHFKNVPEFNPIKAPEQQQEIKKLVNRLSDFQPDKIALEFVRKDTQRVDSLYHAYKQNRHELTVNERQQIGFRLGKDLGHDRVYAIDYKKPWGMNKVLKWADKNNPEFTRYVKQWKKENARVDSILHQNYSISEILSRYADQDFINRVQKIRMRTMEVGADKNYIGVDPVASVYKRNMRIFANLTSIADPGDRILIVYGAGHSYFFNSFVRQHPNMELVTAGPYLAD